MNIDRPFLSGNYLVTEVRHLAQTTTEQYTQ